VVYLALLRGINVGGNNKIAMQDLQKLFEDLGFNNVVTYINTGNIIFSSDKDDQSVIVQDLESAIISKFGLSIRVIIRDYANIMELVDMLPDDWQNDKQVKSDVMFLWPEADSKSVLSELTIKDFDRVIYVPGAVLWSVDRADQGRSGMGKQVGSKLYKQMTIRNVNTVRKLFEIMRQVYEAQ
jgi:uncharacterized protein (DUF1697 family)